MDERSYSRDECQEDLYKIHLDMAQFAIQRGDIAAAITTLAKAIDHQPELTKTYYQLGNCYEQIGDRHNALKTYFAALQVEEKNRARTIPPSAVKLSHTAAWNGEDLSGKSILVLAPASLSKTIQFARFLPLLRERGAMVSFEPQKSLVRLFSSMHLGINIINETNARLRFAIDYYVPLMSLPAIMGIGYNSMPAAHPIIPLPKTLPVALSNALEKPSVLRVGLALNSADEVNCITQQFGAASLFHELASLPGVQLFALDIASGTNKHILYAGQYAQTPDALAAVIKKMDLVIGRDSLAVHLAGALEIPTWLLLAHTAENPLWLPMAEQKTSFWYPAMRIFKQPKSGDWLSVFADVQDALGNLPQKSIRH
jgi:hypothetical protein